jgi:hypothetical protein
LTLLVCDDIFQVGRALSERDEAGARDVGWLAGGDAVGHAIRDAVGLANGMWGRAAHGLAVLHRRRQKVLGLLLRLTHARLAVEGGLVLHAVCKVDRAVLRLLVVREAHKL